MLEDALSVQGGCGPVKISGTTSRSQLVQYMMFKQFLSSCYACYLLQNVLLRTSKVTEIVIRKRQLTVLVCFCVCKRSCEGDGCVSGAPWQLWQTKVVCSYPAGMGEAMGALVGDAGRGQPLLLMSFISTPHSPITERTVWVTPHYPATNYLAGALMSCTIYLQ